MSAPLFAVSGSPTPEELAAVVAVLSARAAGGPGRPAGPPARSLWASPRPADPAAPRSGRMAGQRSAPLIALVRLAAPPRDPLESSACARS